MTVIAIAILLWFVGSILYFTGWISGTLALVVGGVAVVSLVTGAIRFHPRFLPSESSAAETTQRGGAWVPPEQPKSKVPTPLR